jgi:hypothetical protein
MKHNKNVTTCAKDLSGVERSFILSRFNLLRNNNEQNSHLTRGKIEYIQKSLKSTGQSPQDAQGMHKNRPRKISEQILNKIDAHVKSFKGRTSRYSMEKTSNIYLPEELNVTKIFNMFKETNTDVTISYGTYRTAFKKCYTYFI